MKSRNYSLLAFSIVALMMLVLSFLPEANAEFPSLIRDHQLRIPVTIVAIVSGFIAIRLSYISGMQQCWYRGKTEIKMFLTPVATGIVIGLTKFITLKLIKIDLFSVGVIELGSLLYDNLLLSVLLIFVAVTGIIYLVRRYVEGVSYSSKLFWLLAVIISIIESLIIVLLFINIGAFGTLLQPVFIFETFFLSAILSFGFLRYSGFSIMIIFRIAEVLSFGIALLII